MPISATHVLILLFFLVVISIVVLVIWVLVRVLNRTSHRRPNATSATSDPDDERPSR